MSEAEIHAWIEGKIKQRPSYEAMFGKPQNVTFQQFFTMLHVRTMALESIRQKCPDTEASKIAGQALTTGLNSRQLVDYLVNLEEHPKC